MKNELQIFSNPKFGEVRTITENGVTLFCAKDVATALGYKRPADAITAHCKGSVIRRLPSKGGEQDTKFIPEGDIYRLAARSELPGADAFESWIFDEVLPTIRKTGGYNLPKDYPSALRALADAEEKRLALQAENEAQAQTIADFAPIKQYVDTILSSTRTLTTTQIAADYDMSAKKLNKILHEAGIQRYVNGQWILYKQYMGKGYTKSKTINITRSNGRPDTVLNTEWSQKGRILIHSILTARGIQAVMDRLAAV